MPSTYSSALYVYVALTLFCIGGCTDSTPKAAVDAETVRREVARCWQAYEQYAWGHGTLKPLSRSTLDWYPHSLLMTPVDAFDTLCLMELKQKAESCKQLILEQLDFDRDMFVQQFEIHIRLLGGLISAYQLDGDRRFLDLAVDLADRLLPAYDSPTGMPYVMVNLRTGEAKGAISNPTEIGCMMLELGALSRLTGNPVYHDRSKAGIVKLHGLRSEIGLVGNRINVETGEWTGTECHLGGGIDALNARLAIETETGFYYTHVDMHTGKVTTPYFGALDAFFPGVLVLHGSGSSARN